MYTYSAVRFESNRCCAFFVYGPLLPAGGQHAKQKATYNIARERACCNDAIVLHGIFVLKRHQTYTTTM